MIEVKALTKYYGKKLAVEGVSFLVERGEVVGLLGPNGAGKSTTMRVLTGFLPPTSGVARIAGFDVMAQPGEVKARIGYLPETPPLYKEMRVREYLHFTAALKRVPRSRRRRAVEAAIDECGLGEMARRRIEHLSKGYRQRVGLAQAIVHRPPVVILDEPTSGLDPQQVREARALVRRLAEEVTVLVSSHVLSEVEATCGRVIIINRGKLVAVASPGELRDKLRRESEQIIMLQFRGDIDGMAQRLAAHRDVTRLDVLERNDRDGFSGAMCRIATLGARDSRNDLARLVTESGAELLALYEEQVSLEQAFIQLTREGSDEPDPSDL